MVAKKAAAKKRTPRRKVVDWVDEAFPEAEKSSVDHRPLMAHFDFDESVAEVFRDMALRSIPNYELAHQIHADLIVKHLARHQYSNNRILDVGSSLGDFFTYLDQAIAHAGQIGRVSYQGQGIDKSVAMNRRAAQAHPNVGFGHYDLKTDNTFEQFADQGIKYLVINCMYTLQFLPFDRQEQIIKLLKSMLAPEGILIIGTKMVPSFYRRNEIVQQLNDAYISFRLRNGYSIDSIIAKSQSLNNVMFVPTQASLQLMIQHADLETVVETTKAMVFSTAIYVPA